MANAIQNPLYGIQVGSIFKESGKHGASVLKPGLTNFNHQPSSTASMSGTSQYIYTDQMNQGSLTAAGSYGVSGLAKISGAVAGYIGNTTAKSGNSLSINMNLIKWAGVEHIKFNEITPGELLAGLQNNAQAAARRALEAFVKLQKADKHSKDKHSKDKDSKEKLQAEWISASKAFYESFGAGLVVGVLWGGWGTVKLDFTEDNKESKWEGGGNASFSYAGAGAALDLAATYGHTEDTIGKLATAKLDYFVNGACVEADIKGWFNGLQAIATTGLSNLGKERVSQAAAMAGQLKPPKIPGFNKPEPEKQLTDLIGSIDSLDGLHAYAQAAAFEKQKKAGGTDDLAAFLKSAAEANDVSAIPSGAVSPVIDRMVLNDDHDEDDEDLDAGPQDMLARAAEGKKKDEPDQKPTAPDLSDYEPMGIWTIPWGRLFPWLVSGQDNRVPENAPFRTMISLKTLHQDFLSLSRLYDRIRTSGATLSVNGVQVDFKGISTAFSHGASVVDDFLRDDSKRPADPATVKKNINAVINNLQEDAKTIYRTWAAIGELRNCELGAAVVFSAGPFSSSTFHTASRIVPESREVMTVPTPFKHEKSNYDVFSQAVKGWPFVLPDGRVGLFMCDGNKATSGFLTAFTKLRMGVMVMQHSKAVAYDQDKMGTPQADQNLVTFRHSGQVDQNYLFRYCSSEHDKNHITRVEFHPIPFSAAKGIRDWKGAALTTGMGELPGVLKDLRDELAKLKSWSFDSDWWGDTHWNEFRYSMQMGFSYVGLVDEPTNVFGDGG